MEGLSSTEARRRLAEYGTNEIRELVRISPTKIALRQVRGNVVLYLLVVAAVFSFIVGHPVTAWSIVGIVLIIITTGFVQEYKAEQSIKALRSMMLPVATVFRNGRPQQIPAQEIVPGDSVFIRTGEKVPADCVVIEEKDLRVEESILTGESRDLNKFAPAFETPTRENLLFMGTHVVHGRCTARVLHTGLNTEFGKIAGMISTAEKDLLLQQKVNRLARVMTISTILLAILLGTVLFLRGPLTPTTAIEILIVMIALCVAGFPEGFPVVLVSILASGAYRMAHKNAVVNRMSIIETLGETTVICADKTGTITTGEMTVKKVFADDTLFEVTGAGYDAAGDFLRGSTRIDVHNHGTFKLLLKAIVLCNDARIDQKAGEHTYAIQGSSTEAALLILAAKAGLFKEDLEVKREEELTFSSERKMMTVLCAEHDKRFVYAKGAPEILLGKCTHFLRGGKPRLLTAAERKRLLDENAKLTHQSFRTIAVAYKRATGVAHLEQGLIFLGLLALEDSPREEVAAAIRTCHDAGITVKMITGDNKETAMEVAKEIGLAGGVLSGEDLDTLSEEELAKIVRDVAVFARVRPEHKLRIVRALKAAGEIVTMTGDGVNDAPALKEAHIGVAMGRNGTDVSREAADIVLKDDNFTTIVEAVKEGRTIFSNIQKVATYQLSINVGQLLLNTVAILVGMPLPLVAIQILFMNIFSDEVTAFALSFNPPSIDAMKVAPRKREEIFTHDLLVLMLLAGVLIAFISLAVFALAIDAGVPYAEARTLVFVTMVLFAITNAFNFRSFRSPFHRLPVHSNAILLYASLASIVATLLLVYTPLGNKLIETTALSLREWMVAAVASVSILIVFDAIKLLRTHKRSTAHL